MHVLIDGLQANNRSGTGRYTVELLHALNALDTDIRFSTVSSPKSLYGMPEGQLKVTEFGGGAAGRIIAQQGGLTRMVSPRPDLVHYTANIGPMLRTHPFVLTVHDLSFLHHPEWFHWSRVHYYRQVVRRSARIAARVIADSTATKQDLLALAGIPEDRIDVVPLGVSATFQPAAQDEIDRVLKKYDLPGRFFLFVGTIEPRKNLPRLVAAFERIAWEVQHDLVIAGREGWKTGPVHDVVANTASRGRIHFPGFIAPEDLPAVLSAADAFVWPSLFEGFGLPPLEAMACGTPVLTSKTSSLPEVVGGAAFMVDPENIGEIAHALKFLAVGGKMVDTLREGGRQRAAEFTWKRTAEMACESYRKALKG